jgi:hypothetical protein
VRALFRRKRRLAARSACGAAPRDVTCTSAALACSSPGLPAHSQASGHPPGPTSVLYMPALLCPCTHTLQQHQGCCCRTFFRIQVVRALGNALLGVLRTTLPRHSTAGLSWPLLLKLRALRALADKLAHSLAGCDCPPNFIQGGKWRGLTP